jgi:hypothetical protein
MGPIKMIGNSIKNLDYLKKMTCLKIYIIPKIKENLSYPDIYIFLAMNEFLHHSNS